MKLKKYGLYTIVLTMLTTIAIPIDNILGSGSKIFLSDIVIFCVSIVYFGMILFKMKRTTKIQNVFLKYIIVFVSYLLITSGIHTFQFGFSKEYIMIIRNFYAISFLLFFVSSDIVSKKVIENVLLIFVTLSNLYQLIYFATKFEIRSSPLFYNVVIYTIAMQVALVFLFQLSAANLKSKKKFKRKIADFNILSIICLVPMSGLRVGTLVMFAIVLFYMVYFTVLHGKKMLIKCVIGISTIFLLVGGTITSAYITGNMKLLTVVTRTFNVDFSKKDSTVQSKKNINTRSQSDAFRDLINEEAVNVIKKNSLIGKGELQISIFDRATKKVLERLPHNIILEMLIAYGIIGMLLFMSFILLPYYHNTVRFRRKNYYILSLSMLVGFFSFSMVQPTINRILPLQIFFLVQVYFLKCDDLIIEKTERRLDKI